MSYLIISTAVLILALPFLNFNSRMEHTDKILIQAENQLAVQKAIDQLVSTAGVTKRQAWVFLSVISEVKRTFTNNVINVYLKDGMEGLAKLCAETMAAQDEIKNGLEALKEENR